MRALRRKQEPQPEPTPVVWGPLFEAMLNTPSVRAVLDRYHDEPILYDDGAVPLSWP